MARKKREENVCVDARGLDLALEYIENEICKLERRKEELERMGERLIAKHELLERFSNP